MAVSARSKIQKAKRNQLPIVPKNLPGFVTLRVDTSSDQSFELTEREVNEIIQLMLEPGTYRIASTKQYFETPQQFPWIFRGLFEQVGEWHVKIGFREFINETLSSPRNLGERLVPPFTHKSVETWQSHIQNQWLVNKSCYIDHIEPLVDNEKQCALFKFSAISSGDSGYLCPIRWVVKDLSVPQDERSTVMYLWDAYRGELNYDFKCHDFAISSSKLNVYSHPNLKPRICAECECTELVKFTTGRGYCRTEADASITRSWIFNNKRRRPLIRRLMNRLAANYWVKESAGRPSHSGGGGNLPDILGVLKHRRDREQLRSCLAHLILDSLLRITRVHSKEGTIDFTDLSISGAGLVTVHTTNEILQVPRTSKDELLGLGTGNGIILEISERLGRLIHSYAVLPVDLSVTNRLADVVISLSDPGGKI